MTIANKIEAAKKAIVEKKNELSKLADAAANGEAVEAKTLEMLTKSIQEDQAKVASLEKAEQVLIQKSAPAFVKKRGNEYSWEKSAVVALKAKAEGKSQVQVATELYGEDSGTVEVTKTVVDAARTTVPAWAGDLIRDSYGSFLDSLRPMALLPQLAAKGGVSLSFDASNKVIVPYHLSTPNLSGAWITEGASIPVKKTAFGKKTVTQNKLGVITVATSEMLKYSTIDLEAFLKDAILKDTAAVLDAAAFSSSAPATNAPAGLLYDTGASAAVTPNAAASADAQGLIAALKAAINTMTGANMGKNPVVVTTPAVALSIQLLMNATGQFIFANELASGRFMGMPVITSNSAPTGELLVIDAADIYFGLGNPAFAVSDTAALQMNDAPATGPDLTKQGTAEVASLFQQDMFAIRMINHVGWAPLRSGAVQRVTNLAGL